MDHTATLRPPGRRGNWGGPSILEGHDERLRVAQLRRALIAPNVVKVVETRPLEANGEVAVDAFCPRHFQVISGDTTVTAVAYCAPASIGEKVHAVVSPTVFGETVPPA